MVERLQYKSMDEDSQRADVRSVSQRRPYGAQLRGREIRLLKVYPTPLPEPIQCTLDVVSLNDRPDFRALSYVWGDHGNRRDILLNGVSVSVTCNLYTFLDYLRAECLPTMEQRNRTDHQSTKPDSSRNMSPCRQVRWWIDAVCINQNDVEERNSQVRMMPSIYSSACMVLIWLGEDDRGICQSLTLIEEAINSGRILRMDWERHELLILFEHPWFQRAWTLQELLLASDATLSCAHNRLRWNELMPVSEAIAWESDLSVRSLGSHAFQRLCNMQQALRGRRMSLSWLLRQTQYRIASDPRDKVFALLGLLSEQDPIHTYLKPDYTLSFPDVLIHAAHSCIKADGNLSVLSTAGLQYEIGGDLPSWVSDLRLLRDYDDVNLEPRRSSLACYRDSHALVDRSRLWLGPRSGGSFLHVRGFVVAVLESDLNENMTALWRREYLPATNLADSSFVSKCEAWKYKTFAAALDGSHPAQQTVVRVSDAESKDYGIEYGAAEAGDLICLLFGGRGCYLLRQENRGASLDPQLTGADATFQLVGHMLNVDYDLPPEVGKFFDGAVTGEGLACVDFVLI